MDIMVLWSRPEHFASCLDGQQHEMALELLKVLEQEEKQGM
jgi:hypothetical protein